ncbi:peptidoglycan-binding protein [Streptomyces sp. A3M-1-3]|uniref:peptidoglycan-binding protein n=1 Tax=Streptomyces sp. A3M-1-3 TaxID=2962044 RepID=UPI0020B8B499|nr:peptidoglycan-binding protein [Streptomyces sp. A3M-1-3]MCP3819339.1 peptidoglycan-binding protein [Streptomyces sp. A3M-1-3]
MDSEEGPPESAEELQESRGHGLSSRRRVLLAVVAGAILLSAGGIGATAFIKSPADQASSVGPPPADVLTAPVEYRVLNDSVVIRGQVTAAQTVDVSPGSGAGQEAARAVVTKTPFRAGDTFGAGKVLVEISGRPVFALAGRLPVYRDLKPGTEGKDVTQLQRALEALGNRVAGDRDGFFGPGTKRALSRHYASIGYDPLAADPEGDAQVSSAEDAVTDARRAWEDAAEGKEKKRAAEDLDRARSALSAVEAANGPMLPASEVVYLLGFPARVETLKASVGSEAKEKLLTVSAGELVVNGRLDASRKDLVRPGQKVQILSETTGAEQQGTIAGVTDAPVQEGDGDADGGGGGPEPGGYLARVRPDKALPAALAGHDVRLTVEAASSKGRVLVVPASAVSAGADGKTVVYVYRPDNKDRRRVEVATGTTGNGFVAVRPLSGGPLRTGDQVIVGIREGGGA